MTSNGPARSKVPGDFFLGDWLVQPGLGRISRNGTILRVRPQLLDVLACLAGRPGQVVTRDELLETVWSGQYVQESGLGRCIAELRQALDDSAQAPTYIETIPKRGYRVVAPVRPLAEHLTAIGSEHADAAEPGSTPDGVQAPSPHGVWPRLPIGIGAALVLIALTAAGVWWWGRAVDRELAERDTVVVAFENRTGDAVFDGTLHLGLVIQLEQSPFLRVVSSQRVREELAFMNRRTDEAITGPVATEVCQRVGAKAVVLGSIAALGRHYLIGIEAVACQDGSVLVRQQVEASSKEHVLVTLGRAVSEVRRRLGESVASIRGHDVPIVRATTASLEALKALSLGDLARGRGQDAEAASAYRRAVAADAGFALAYGRLGVHLLDLAVTPPSEGIAMLRRAFELRDRVSPGERHYIESHYHRRVSRDPYRAIQALETWRDAFPAHAAPRVTLATMYGETGCLVEAEREAREARRLDPGSTEAATALMIALTALDRLDEARAIGEDLVASRRAGVPVHATLLQIAFIAGDSEGMRRQFEWAAATPSAEALFASRQAAMAVSRGQVSSAMQVWRARIARAAERGDHELAAHTTARVALHLALVGRRADAVGMALDATRRSSSPETFLYAALALGLADRVDEAERLLQAYAAMPGIEAGSDPDMRQPAEALVAIRRGRIEDAMAKLAPRPPDEPVPQIEGVTAYVRGLAEQAAARPARAVEQFNRITSHPGAFSDALLYPMAWLQLGRARAAAGDRPGARAAYDRFLRLWKDADPDVPALVEARREAARLPPGVRS